MRGQIVTLRLLRLVVTDGGRIGKPQPGAETQQAEIFGRYRFGDELAQGKKQYKQSREGSQSVGDISPPLLETENLGTFYQPGI
jgi:hypothetical protein